VQLTTDPVVAGGIAYVGSYINGTLNAFSASATSGCAGTPVVCSPLWTADVDPTHTGVSDPVVANGIVYVSGGNGTLSAFDAAGKTNCSGSPIVCSPLWTANPATASSPVYANGVIYIAANSGLEAFDAAGVTNCTGNPKVCSPLWTTSVQGGFVSIANGIAYLAGAGTQVYALDATGTTNCAGTPKVCSPLWQLQTDLPTIGVVLDYPVISGGTVFIATASPYRPPPAVLQYNVEAFDASGITNCSGAPKICAPVWTTSNFPTVLPPAVGDGNVWVTSLANGSAAFDAGGVKNCSGGVCSPVWTSPTPGPASFQTPTIAGGVAFIVGGNHLYALDATGQVGCSTSVCSPLWTSPTSSYGFTSDLVVANGLVYVVATDGDLRVYGLS
jgi:eukaryotic-like serine/threonine-protein kinase